MENVRAQTGGSGLVDTVSRVAIIKMSCCCRSPVTAVLEVSMRLTSVQSPPADASAAASPPRPCPQSTAGVDTAKAGRLPAALTRRFDVYFVPEERIPLSQGGWPNRRCIRTLLLDAA